jgi:DNA polymerase (family 10)
MTNADVARVFAEVADLLEIRGEDVFRVNSYRRVARTIEDLAVDINEIAARGELTGLPGVGKGSAEKIQELLSTGKLRLREELLREIPESLLELRQIPGVGPKKIALLWKERGIRSLADLKAAIQAGTLAGLKGLGDKSIQQIKEGIEFLERSAGRVRLGIAAAVAESICHRLKRTPGVRRVEPAGSLRRGRETVGDLDLLCIADDPEAAIRSFTGLPEVARVLAAGQTKGSVLYQYASGQSLQVDLRVVPEESFGAAWQYFTGSKEHNIRLRELALKRGWSLNEYGLTEGQRIIASRTEEEIYAALGLPWIPPELREDRGEFDTPPPEDLLTLDDIRGDLHVHTTESDGIHTLEQMVAAAAARGYRYLCIADHSRSSTIANGLTPQRLEKQIEQVRRLARKTRGLKLLIGTEVDILADGSLDFPDELLSKLDFVTASIHSAMGRDAVTNTRRTIAAMQNRYVNVIGHPTGRLIGRREAMALDIEAICREAARTGTALEINASNLRLDLKDQHARLAREMGALVCINTDAHSVDELEEMRFGVLTARRAGLRRSDVLNTRSPAELMKFVQAKRKRKA